MNIVITGGSQGIGYEAALIFAGFPGNKILVVARNQDNLRELAYQCSGCPSQMFPFRADLNTDLDSIIREIRNKLDSVDILINNAGAMVYKPFVDITHEDFDRVFQTNIRSVFFLIQDLLPLFRQDSHIVNIGSMGGVQGSVKFPGLSAYSASKGALAILTECLALELKEKKINVNCLALGAAQTEMLLNAFPGYKAPVTARQMADFICNFAMTGQRYFNGKIIPVSSTTP